MSNKDKRNRDQRNSDKRNDKAREDETVSAEELKNITAGRGVRHRTGVIGSVGFDPRTDSEIN